MSVFKKLEEGIVDLSELSVQTFTGTLKSVVNDTTTTKGVVDWEKLMAEAKSSGDVILVASTKIELDGDASTYYESDAPTNLIKAHNETVTAAQTYRQGLLSLFKAELGIK